MSDVCDMSVFINARTISAACADPQKDASIRSRPLSFTSVHGDKEEAFWLVFMFVHFGKHARGGWRYIREIYGNS